MNYQKLAFATIISSVCFTAHAGVVTQASCGTPNPNVRALDIGTSAASCAVASDYDYYGYMFSGSGTAVATAQYGVLKASATSSGSPSQGNGSTAVAIFNDSLTINADGMQGKRGVVTFGFVHHWTALQTHDSTGWSGVQTSLSAFAYNIAGGGGQHSFRSYRNDTSGGIVEYTAYNNGKYVTTDQPFVIDIPFYFGYAFTVELSLVASASGGANGVFSGSYTSVMDAGHSGYWDGVKGMRTDEPLTSPWTITGATGTDYNRSFLPPVSEVPEPASAALLALGGAALVYRRRKQSR